MPKDLEEIFKYNERWIKEQLSKDENYFKNLAKKQNPRYLFFGCSDSRISSEVIMYAEPGDVFVHRNIANLVPTNDLNVLSVISYAVMQLNVEHIVVCGHYGCGGVKTAMTTRDEGILNPWLRQIRDVYRLHKDELNGITDHKKKYDRLVELNVMEQCINLVKTRDVQVALKEKRIRIHGWVFDMNTGRINDLKFDSEKHVEEIMAIYNYFSSGQKP